MAPVCRTVQFSRTNADAPTKEVLEAGYAGMTMTPSRSSDIYSFGKTPSILYSVSKDASNYNNKDGWWTTRYRISSLGAWMQTIQSGQRQDMRGENFRGLDLGVYLLPLDTPLL